MGHFTEYKVKKECDWCSKEITELVKYGKSLFRACSKDCAHGIKRVNQMYETLGMGQPYPLYSPDEEEQVEFVERSTEPTGEEDEVIDLFGDLDKKEEETVPQLF